MTRNERQAAEMGQLIRDFRRMLMVQGLKPSRNVTNALIDIIETAKLHEHERIWAEMRENYMTIKEMEHEADA